MNTPSKAALATQLALAVVAATAATNGWAGQPNPPYPVPMHGIWVANSAEGRAECLQLKSTENYGALLNALLIDPIESIEISEGERSHSELASIQSIGAARWRITERFHAHGDLAFELTHSTFDVSSDRQLMKQRYQYTDSGKTQNATKQWRKCL